MNVAIIGAGALGRVYAVLLVKRAKLGVTLVVRPGREEGMGAIRIERVDGDQVVMNWAEPVVSSSVPPHADAVIVTVRAEQLDGSLDRLLEATSAPVVVLTPMMPDDFARLSARFGTRLRAGMAGAVAYVKDSGTCRYWLPRMAATLVDSARPGSEESKALVELVGALSSAGLNGRLELGVPELNAATTVSITAAAMGLDAGGSIDALLDDAELLRVTLEAIGEGVELGKHIGKSAGWLGLLMPFVGKRMLRIGVSLARKRWPESLSYVEMHFGRKLRAQNVVMGRAIVELAKKKGTAHQALGRLLAKLEAAAC
jgi:ketopantoate reductase